jgi:outer membrane protein/protease secretion system outer membrane protein
MERKTQYPIIKRTTWPIQVVLLAGLILWMNQSQGQAQSFSTDRIDEKVPTLRPNFPGQGFTNAGLLAPESPLGLLEAWRLAVDNDPTLRAAGAAAAAGRERRPQAESQLLPNVAANAARYNNDVNRDALDSFSQVVSNRSRYVSRNETLVIRQPVLYPQRWIGLRQANYQVEDAEAMLEREVQNLAVRVASAYFDLMLAGDQAQLLASQSEFLQSRLTAASRAIAGGTGTRTDLDDAQARFDLNRAQRLEALQAIQARRRQLQALTYRPIGELSALEPRRLSLVPPTPGSAEAWVLMAIDNSPEIRSARARLSAATEEVNRTKAAHYPTIDAVAQWQRSRNEVITQPQTGYTNASVGVQMNLPIYFGGYTESTVREARAQQLRASEVLEATQLDLGVRVHTEFNAITEGIERIKALEVAARSAEVALDSARKSVVAGVRTSLDVLNAQQQRTQVLRDLAQARYGLLLSRVRLLALAGRIDEPAFAQISESLHSAN